MQSIRAVYKLLLDIVARIYVRYIRAHWHSSLGRACLRPISKRGIDVRFHGEVTIISPSDICIGDHVRIGKGAYINCLGGVFIGRNVQISRNVTIYSSNRNYRSSKAVPYDDTYLLAPVKIEDSVWVGMGVSILPGVTIGEGAIIGMGAVITKDIPRGAVVVGSGQRIVGERDMITFQDLANAEAFFGKIYADL